MEKRRAEEKKAQEDERKRVELLLKQIAKLAVPEISEKDLDGRSFLGERFQNCVFVRLDGNTSVSAQAAKGINWSRHLLQLLCVQAQFGHAASEVTKEFAREFTLLQASRVW